jgi:hypothetical protein
VAVHLENLLEAFDLLLGLGQMRLEALLQFRIRRVRNHLRQSLGDLVLGVINVLDLMHEEIVERFDVAGEETHVMFLSLWGASSP